MGVVCFLDEGGDFIYKWAGGGVPHSGGIGFGGGGGGKKIGA